MNTEPYRYYTCSKCGAIKPEFKFHAWKGNLRGRRPECMECTRLWQEAYNKRRREEREREAGNNVRRLPRLGEKAPNWKLSTADCENIRLLRSGGMKYEAIAAKYGIHWNTAWKIVNYHERALA